MAPALEHLRDRVPAVGDVQRPTFRLHILCFFANGAAGHHEMIHAAEHHGNPGIMLPGGIQMTPGDAGDMTGVMAPELSTWIGRYRVHSYCRIDSPKTCPSDQAG